MRKLQGTVKDGSLACCSSWGRKESDMPESLNNNRNFLSVTCAFILITQNVLKSRDIILPTKIHIVKTMVFVVVRYGCKNWTIKKAECQRTDAFEFWCWRRLLRVSWTARRSIQSLLKEISPEYSLEGLILKLKLQYFGHLM